MSTVDLLSTVSEASRICLSFPLSYWFAVHAWVEVGNWIKMWAYLKFSGLDSWGRWWRGSIETWVSKNGYECYLSGAALRNSLQQPTAYHMDSRWLVSVDVDAEIAHRRWWSNSFHSNSYGGGLKLVKPHKVAHDTIQSCVLWAGVCLTASSSEFQQSMLLHVRLDCTSQWVSSGL
jgi:hypothetical protein